MKRWSAVLAVAAVCAGCQDKVQDDKPTRAQIRKTGPATMEVIPADGQLPYCMLYTVSEKGVIRQLTLTKENRSIRCEANKPVANTSFRIPTQEGKVKVYIFFSDDRIPAGPVAQQLYDLRAQERISAMDLRLPGRVQVETLDFVPELPSMDAQGEAPKAPSNAPDMGVTVNKDNAPGAPQPAASGQDK
ncbi:hypothetical protein NVS55_30535 [Myxococcus stipitatus]|uniref:hypothetical protein n=1 Tax=Myxococcus stipitatus TaxID=83455 RepID=UPI0031450144